MKKRRHDDNVTLLIPPSEGKAEGGTGAPLKKVSAEVQYMIDRLKLVKGDEWEKLLGVKGASLEKAIQANQSILTSPTMPAIERYSGVVYNGIDYQTLDAKAQKEFNTHVRIISAVFGLVKPDQMIPNYKLKIEKFGADKHWKPIIADQLNNAYVIDLLPKAHKKAVAWTKGIEVEFVILKNGKVTPAGHNGKFIKGRFVRWLCQQKNISIDCLDKFNEDGFVWNGQRYIKED